MTNIPAGAVITMNGLKFVKLRNDPVKGAQFMALQAAPLPPCGQGGPCVAPNSKNGTTMQAFTTAMCAAFGTPAATGNVAGSAAGNVTVAGVKGYTLVGTLTDSRDSKTYEVRKFSDGKCWMVDNLAFGSGCLKTTFAGSDTTGTGPTGSSRQNVQSGYYGDCRYPYVSTATSDATNKYGYLYDWVAATQNTSAYFGSNFQPPQPTQGICPTGWSLPLGGSSGQFQALHTVAGSPSTGFWQPGSNWKGVYSGYWNSSGALSSQGSHGYFWSSTQYSSNAAYGLLFDSSTVYPSSASSKDGGWAVRCVKN